jgi:rod shape-determining protein MreD
MIMLHRHGGWVIFTSFVVAFIFTIFPLPNWLSLMRPEWAALVLIYWCMALPQRIGVGIGWITGILLDVLRASLLGQHALSLCILAYVTIKLYQRIRVFPLWQQALSILVLVALHQVLMLWIQGIAGHPIRTWTYWLPSISSMLIWPLLYIVLRNLRRHFRVT